MSIYNAIANHGRNVGAGLNAFAQGKYQVAQDQRANELQDENRAYVKSRNVLADQRYEQGQQRQATADQLAFGQQTLQLLSSLPPEQRKAAYMARAQEAAQTVGLPQGFNPEEGWARAASQLPPPVDPEAEFKDFERKERLKASLKDKGPQAASFEDESKLRKEFQGLTKEFRQQEAAMGRIIASSSKPSAAGDIALIFNYMKMLDPGSTVREGEFATAQNAQGVDGQVRNMYNKLRTGERLNPSQRADFLSQAGNIYGEAAKNFETTRGDYKSLASQYKADPGRIGVRGAQYGEGDFSGLGVPKKGDVVDGYVFNGGDPGEESNWKKK